jgi:hypothetical protein
MVINKNIEQITEEDLQALIDNEVVEHKTIEYKQTLPGGSPREKKDFLADISSFANASGGDIVYGLAEDRRTGKPRLLSGLDIENLDQEILRLDNIIRTGIQPRLPSLTISPPILLSNSTVALVIRVLKSYLGPHRVVYGGYDKFYSRSSNGKYQLDVGELRIAFNLSETITERITNFKTNRITEIIADETPVPLYNNPRIVLHIIPFNSFSPTQNYEVNILSTKPGDIKPINCGGWNGRYNMDGLLSYSWNKEKGSHSYVQLYRNGIIEAVEALFLEPHEGKLFIPSIAYERELINSLTEYLNILKTLGVDAPLFIFLTFLRVKGYSMAVRNSFFFNEGYSIDRDHLLLPEIIVESMDTSTEQLLQPIFNNIWNACGYPKDIYYNEEGKWNPR